jgi:hypothetical protein
MNQTFLTSCQKRSSIHSYSSSNTLSHHGTEIHVMTLFPFYSSVFQVCNYMMSRQIIIGLAE